MLSEVFSQSQRQAGPTVPPASESTENSVMELPGQVAPQTPTIEALIPFPLLPESGDDSPREATP